MCGEAPGTGDSGRVWRIVLGEAVRGGAPCSAGLPPHPRCLPGTQTGAGTLSSPPAGRGSCELLQMEGQPYPCPWDPMCLALGTAAVLKDEFNWL